VADQVGSIDRQVIQQADSVVGLVLGRPGCRWTGASRKPAPVVPDFLEGFERWFGHEWSVRIGEVRAVD
jgi:hypothetical protein